LDQIKRVDPSNENNYLPTTDFSWINGGNGTFGSSSSKSLGGGTTNTKIVFGDINGDGRSDFIKAYAPTGSNPYVYVYPYLANSTGGFDAQPSKTLERCPTGYISVALGDINGDGKADIVSNGLSGQVHAYISYGNGTFSSKYTTTGAANIVSIYLAELNGDGKADLVKLRVVQGSGGYVYSALSNGNGYFGTQNVKTLMDTPLYGYRISLADVNGDGIADLYFNGSSPKRVG
jgi:hypothetical protein